MKKLSEKYVTIHEIKEYVDKYIEERGKPRIYEQELTVKYCEIFATLDKEKVEKMKEEIKNAVPRIPEKVLIKIIDILPTTYELLHLITAEEAIYFTEEESKKILEIVKKYTEGENK